MGCKSTFFGVVLKAKWRFKTLKRQPSQYSGFLLASVEIWAMVAQSKVHLDWSELTDNWWMELSSIELYEKVMTVMLEIEASEHPEDYQNVAILFSRWLTQEASRFLGHDAWVCSYSYNHVECTCWPGEDEYSGDSETDEPIIWCDDGSTIVKRWTIRKKQRT